MLNDTIADLLTRIRNALLAKHRYVDVRYSKMKKAIAHVLKENQFIENYIVDDKAVKLRIYLKYGKEREPFITNLKRISKPGARKYVPTEAIPKVHNGLGIAILSTSKGVVDSEKARQAKLGGELLCYVW